MCQTRHYFKMINYLLMQTKLILKLLKGDIDHILSIVNLIRLNKTHLNKYAGCLTPFLSFKSCTRALDYIISDSYSNKVIVNCIIHKLNNILIFEKNIFHSTMCRAYTKDCQTIKRNKT